MRRRKTAVFFLIFGISLSVLAVALNVGWIILNIREVALLVFGVIFFILIITGLILNTIFLVREIRRNEQHDAFLNAVTHELKTPIASIKLYLETLKARDLDPQKRKEFYDIMLADNQRLLSTVEQVLLASRTREKQRQLNLTEINVGDLLGDTIKTIREQQHLNDSTIRLTASGDGIRVIGDKAELGTAFANLLDNAIKYSGGEPKVAIRVGSTSGKTAEIYIKDNGIGIPRGDLKRVFKRFYRAANAAGGDAKGNGLGLAIVRSIIEKHGGSVIADSKGVGKGTTFLVQLPKV